MGKICFHIKSEHFSFKDQVKNIHIQSQNLMGGPFWVHFSFKGWTGCEKTVLGEVKGVKIS